MQAERRVVVIYGPPGAGKSTLARTLGLHVFDLDEWPGTRAEFRRAIAALRTDQHARAVVIRADPYSGTSELVGATEQIVLDTPLAECISRIRSRHRTRPPIKTQIAAAQEWWQTYERHGRQSSDAVAEKVRRRQL